MANNEEISNWLSAERQWDACKKWMHSQGKKISVPTMRRAFAEGGRTHRQRLAIDLMRQFYTQQTSRVYPRAIETTLHPFAGQ